MAGSYSGGVMERNKDLIGAPITPKEKLRAKKLKSLKLPASVSWMLLSKRIPTQISGVALPSTLLYLILQAVAPPAPRAHVDGGVVEGKYFGPGSADAVFEGIPFAAPPVGALRWKPPAPVQPWRGIRNAKDFPPI